MFRSKYQKNYERTNAEKEVRALSGLPPAILPSSGSTMLHNQFPVATYLNSPDYYSGGAGALVPTGSLMPSAGYRPYSPYYPAGGLGNYVGSAYQHPYSHMSQHPYSYGYGGYGGYGVSAFLVATCVIDIPTTIIS
ncbi:hypothetical protein BS47DRAFT_977562 [Hydnum rufescens UP504]|uniref:Uncharacterized protein n=1 Tax=Hydnum rufescens UP504 TaxID=1448309 RepID=A0A9P6AXT4_9AGAM|nr:hypothetical protein BS47DRAFT_977562 [Hydnum rufescens UP504]